MFNALNNMFVHVESILNFVAINKIENSKNYTSIIYNHNIKNITNVSWASSQRCFSLQLLMLILDGRKFRKNTYLVPYRPFI